MYQPKRKFKQKVKKKISEWSHVQSVLLEYGREFKMIQSNEENEKDKDQDVELLNKQVKELETLKIKLLKYE